MKVLRCAIVPAVLCLTPMAAGVAAQGAFPPKSFTNLQVLPQESRPGDVVSAMKAFTSALGVRCPHCHVGEEGMPLDTFDFAADTRSAKQTARAMMRLVQQINATLDQAVPTTATTARVTCMTCHAGQKTPRAQ